MLRKQFCFGPLSAPYARTQDLQGDVFLFDFLSSGLKPSSDRKNIEGSVQKNLGQPLQDLFSRPKKQVRAQLVHMGFELIAGRSPSSPEDLQTCEACGEAIEALHTGSLIIDDIQDLSEWRRGGPTLHLKYGVPTALNAGNWLYFYAFQKIRESSQNPLLRVQLYELMEQVLREAHLGQALDIGTDVSKLSCTEMIEISRASLEMKSGALMALALLMGGTAARADEEQMKDLKEFGIGFGVSLQMFDDLGNVKIDRPTQKHLEDLSLRRPSFVWWSLAENYSSEISNFCAAVEKLPATEALDKFLMETPLLKTGFSHALGFQSQILERMKLKLKPHEKLEKQFFQIAEKVAHAY